MIEETRKQQKQQLILDNKFSDYRKAKKEWYSLTKDERTFTTENGSHFVMELSKNPEDYGLTQEELNLCIAIDKGNKKKKRESRTHIHFMHKKYDYLGFLTLTFSDKRRNQMNNIQWIRNVMTNTLNLCFEDYIGKLEVSPNGKIHGHFIVAWNSSEEPKTRDIKRGNCTNKLVINFEKLTKNWYGTKDKNGQPTKYGIYDLILIKADTYKDLNKCSNYVFKTLNSMESYIDKSTEENENFEDFVNIAFVSEVNSMNTFCKRNTPYTRWIKAYREQNKEIRDLCRVFDNTFFENNRYNGPEVFRQWADYHKNDTLKDDLKLFKKDFKLVEINDF